MKILAVLGSPKGKGAGYGIARKIETAMAACGSVSFEYLFLKDLDVRPCKGCFLCVTHGEDRCSLQDDRVMIEKRIDQADGIILVSPCYVSSVSALMKNFMDRMCYTNHRPRFFRQKMLLVSNASAGMEQTLETLRRTLGPGPRITGRIAALTPPWPLTPRAQARQDSKIRREAVRLYNAIRKDQPRNGLPKRPSFSGYLQFRFFKKISADTRNYLQADYAYYSQLDNFHYPASIGMLQRLAAGAVLSVGMLFMKDLAPPKKPA
jgi:NAD(P)H-dependent FMN reductase